MEKFIQVLKIIFWLTCIIGVIAIVGKLSSCLSISDNKPPLEKRATDAALKPLDKAAEWQKEHHPITDFLNHTDPNYKDPNNVVYQADAWADRQARAKAQGQKVAPQWTTKFSNAPKK